MNISVSESLSGSASLSSMGTSIDGLAPTREALTGVSLSESRSITGGGGEWDFFAFFLAGGMAMDSRRRVDM